MNKNRKDLPEDYFVEDNLIIENEDKILEGMHELIMAEIEKRPAPRRSRLRMPSVIPGWWRENKNRIAKISSLSVLGLLVFMQVQRPAPDSVATQEIIERIEKEPRLVAQMSLTANYQDFLVDVATESLNHLDEDQIKGLLND